MTNNKQSSVEMIEEFLLSHCNPTICNVEWSDFKLMLEQAKEMHKKEMVMFVLNVMGKYRNGDVLAEVATEFYEQTYGGGEQ